MQVDLLVPRRRLFANSIADDNLSNCADGNFRQPSTFRDAGDTTVGPRDGDMSKILRAIGFRDRGHGL
ncbi:hypothetical protein DMB37_33525 [Nocardia sp. CS682]|nr:hypothetical protein DMB37_33525 [Nocardia sp. CS682]